MVIKDLHVDDQGKSDIGYRAADIYKIKLIDQET